MIHPTLINSRPNKYSQDFHCYLFTANRFIRSCNTLNILPNEVCVPNKTEDLNLSVLKMIIGIN